MAIPAPFASARRIRTTVLGFLRIRKTKSAIVAALVLTLLLAGHTMLETARDALFLNDLPSSWLPLAYLCVAVTAVLTSRGAEQLRTRFHARHVLTITMLVGAALALAFWRWLETSSTVALFALYVFPGILTTTALIQFWTAVHARLDVERAKADYPIIGAGGLIGAIVGGAVATGIANLTSARGLLLGAAVLFTLTAGLTYGIRPRRSAPTSRRSGTAPSAKGTPSGDVPAPHDARATDGAGASAILRDRYALLLLGLFVSMACSAVFIDYLYKSEVAAEVPPERLAEVFGIFQAGISALALLTQLTLLPWLLQRFSVHRAVILLPALLAVGSLLGFVLPAMIAAISLRAFDGSLRHSLFGTASEIFYLPLKTSNRQRIKTLVEALGKRGGQALGSLMILALLYVGFSELALWGLIAVAAALSIWACTRLRRAYVERFRERLRERVMDPTTPPPELSMSALESLITALSSTNQREVAAALDLLRLYDRTGLVSPLILHHPSSPVVLHALDILSLHQPSAIRPLLGPLLERSEPEVRAAALRTACALDPGLGRRAMHRLRDDEHELVQATRHLAELSLSGFGDRDPDSEIRLLLQKSRQERIAIGHALHLVPEEIQVPLAMQLLEDRDDDLWRAVTRGVSLAPSEVLLPVMLRLLESETTRIPVRDTLRRMPASRVVPYLQRALENPARDIRVRRHIPRTLSCFAISAVSDHLSRWLLEEPDVKVQLKILRGLGRLRADHPRLPVDRRALHLVTRRILDQGLADKSRAQILHAAAECQPELATSSNALLCALLNQRRERAIERLFRILGVLYPRQDFRIVHTACLDESASVRAASRELLRHTLPTRLQKDTLRLLEEQVPSLDDVTLPDEHPFAKLAEAIDRAQEEGGDLTPLHARCLEQLTHDESPAIATVAREGLRRAEGPEPPTSGQTNGPRLSVVVERVDLHAGCGHWAPGARESSPR